MRKSQKIIAALMAAVMTATSSALTFANADNADSETDIIASLTTVYDKSEKEYTFDDIAKMSEDEVSALFNEKGMTDEKKYSVWTKEKVEKAMEDDNIVILLKPEARFVTSSGRTVINEFDEAEELFKNDDCYTEQLMFLTNAIDMPKEKVWLFGDGGCEIQNEGNDEEGRIYRRYYRSMLSVMKENVTDEESKVIADALNYLQLSPYYHIVKYESKLPIYSGETPSVLKGDVNCDGSVDMADAVLIMQALANPNKYGENGTADNHLTAQGKENGDFNGDGLTVGDAQSIQKQLLGFDITEGQSAASLLGLMDGKVKNAVVTRSIDSKEYVFTDEKAQAVADYLSGLHLITNFSEIPDNYDGGGWTISLEYENEDFVTVWHNGNMFIRNPLKPWYKMIYEEAQSFDGLLYELSKKSDTTDTSTAMSSIRLDDKVSVQAAEGKTADEKFAAAEMKLGIELLKKGFDPTKRNEENMLISPVSISAALTMTANGADGKTRDEMEKVLGNGLTIDQLNEYMASYIRKLPRKEKETVYMADSIWFKDKPTFKVYDEFLEQNKKYYNAELYKAAFDNDTVNDVNSWVSKNTEGMIPGILEKDSLTPTENEEMLMLLINTLYFEAEWQNMYDWAPDGKFTDLNGNKRTIKQLISQEREYFDLGDADAFKKPYAGGDYSFVGILPRDNDIVEYVKNLDAEELLAGLSECEDPDTVDLYTMIPKFEYEYGKGLNDILKAMGMPTAFGGGADFSKINDLSVEGADYLYISKVIHKTKIELTESGTKAAAVSAVGMAAGCAMMPEQKKEVYIYLDRPFVYMIVDKNNVPLFIGVATQLGDLQ